MFRQSLAIAKRGYVTAVRKPVVSRNVSRVASKSPTAAKPTIKTESAAPIIDEEVFFEPPEFALQTGQPREPPSSSQGAAAAAASSFALKGQPLNEKFTATLDDQPPIPTSTTEINWSTSYYGLADQPFPDSVQQVLNSKLEPEDIEIKPDGLIYLPEIKYRRILNRAFGAGAWGLIPRSKTIVTDKLLTREYALVCLGRLVGIARGEQDYFSPDGIPTATEGCKSNALMRCCKDLGIASELWDPNFIRSFKSKYCEDKFVEHVTTKRKRKIWKRKDRGVDYPYKLT